MMPWTLFLDAGTSASGQRDSAGSIRAKVGLRLTERTCGTGGSP